MMVDQSKSSSSSFSNGCVVDELPVRLFVMAECLTLYGVVVSPDGQTVLLLGHVLEGESSCVVSSVGFLEAK